MVESPTDLFATSRDGLRLHYTNITPSDATSQRTPAVCLPGLARTTDDFRLLAEGLARESQTPRRVLAIDYRGRGLSDRDPDWRHYDLTVERADFLGILQDLGIERAHFVGTSRGGLHILALAGIHRSLIQSAIFNDIGPVLEPDGLARIKSYVGKPVTLTDFDEAILLLKSAGGRHFEGLSDAEWRYFAETTFGRNESALGLRYDPMIAHTLDGLDITKPAPESWHLFDKLTGAPVLTIRGENSDLLSEATCAAMGARWPGCETITVPGHGHAPLLADAKTIERIDRFLAAADSHTPRATEVRGQL